MAQEREIFYEFFRLGGTMKVTAIDGATGIEVTIVGDPAAGEEALKRVARQKLAYVMERKRGG